MTAIQLRSELFREISPLLDSEVAMKQVLMFIRSLSPVQKEKDVVKNKTYKRVSVSPEIEKWSGCTSFTSDEIESDSRLKALLSR